MTSARTLSDVFTRMSMLKARKPKDVQTETYHTKFGLRTYIISYLIENNVLSVTLIDDDETMLWIDQFSLKAMKMRFTTYGLAIVQMRDEYGEPGWVELPLTGWLPVSISSELKW